MQDVTRGSNRSICMAHGKAFDKVQFNINPNHHITNPPIDTEINIQISVKVDRNPGLVYGSRSVESLARRLKNSASFGPKLNLTCTTPPESNYIN